MTSNGLSLDRSLPWAHRAGPAPTLALPTHPAPRPLTAHLPHTPHEVLAHLVMSGPLHGREEARHLLILVLLQLDHLHPAGLQAVHQLPHAVRIRRHARLHLAIQGPAPLHLLLHQRPAPGAEPLVRG